MAHPDIRHAIFEAMKDDDPMLGISSGSPGEAADHVAEAVMEVVRQNLENAMQNIDRDIADVHGAVIFGMTALTRQQKKALRDAESEKKGVQRVAKLLDIEIFEPYEPSV